MNQQTRLPCATHPRPDELLSSWLTRLAHAHLMKTYTFGKILFPDTNLWNRDLDKIAPEGVLQTLAKCTATPLHRIRETGLRRYEGKLYLNHNHNGNTKWILPLGIYHRTHRQFGLLFCPTCLKKDGDTPYFRTHWRLALANICTECGVYLHEKCPVCEKPVTFFRVELGRKSAEPDTPISHCFYCRFDLAKAPVIAASVTQHNMQIELGRIYRQGWKEQAFFPHLYFDVLHQLIKVLTSSRNVCAGLQHEVDKQTGWNPIEECGAVRRSRIPFEMLPLAARGGIMWQAQWLLTEWPSRFIDITKRSRTTSTPLLYDMTAIPFWFHSVVEENLYMSNRNRRFGDFWR